MSYLLLLAEGAQCFILDMVSLLRMQFLLRCAGSMESTLLDQMWVFKHHWGHSSFILYSWDNCFYLVLSCNFKSNTGGHTVDLLGSHLIISQGSRLYRRIGAIKCILVIHFLLLREGDGWNRYEKKVVKWTCAVSFCCLLMFPEGWLH